MNERLEELKDIRRGMLETITICLEQIHFATSPSEYKYFNYGDSDYLIESIERQLHRMQNLRRKMRALEEAIKEEEQKDVRL